MDQIANLINNLTPDEDYRQELWVYYLSGNSPALFAAYLEMLQLQYCVDRRLQESMWRAPSIAHFSRVLSYFSEFEQSIVCLLAIGLTASQISKYKNISEIRIRQAISVIRGNRCWKELYGIEEEAH